MEIQRYNRQKIVLAEKERTACGILDYRSSNVIGVFYSILQKRFYP
jgi:hypothetical protein